MNAEERFDEFIRMSDKLSSVKFCYSNGIVANGSEVAVLKEVQNFVSNNIMLQNAYRRLNKEYNLDKISQELLHEDKTYSHHSLQDAICKIVSTNNVLNSAESKTLSELNLENVNKKPITLNLIDLTTRLNTSIVSKYIESGFSHINVIIGEKLNEYEYLEKIKTKYTDLSLTTCVDILDESMLGKDFNDYNYAGYFVYNLVIVDSKSIQLLGDFKNIYLTKNSKYNIYNVTTGKCTANRGLLTAI